MDRAKLPDGRAKLPDGLGRDLLRGLENRFQLALASDAALGPIVAMKTAGTLPKDNGSMWTNELHPTPAGFRFSVTDEVLPALTQSRIA